MLSCAEREENVQDARPRFLIVAVFDEQIRADVEGASKTEKRLVMDGRIDEERKDEGETTIQKVDVGNAPIAVLHAIHQHGNAICLNEIVTRFLVSRDEAKQHIDRRGNDRQTLCHTKT